MPYIEELNISICDNCATECKKQCATCKYAKYCSRECMQVDWKRHVKECPQLTIFAEERATYIQWVTENRNFLRTMVESGHIIQLKKGHHGMECNKTQILTYIRNLSKTTLDHLLKFVDAEEKRGDRGSSPCESKKYQMRQFSRPDTPCVILATDGVPTEAVDVTTLNKFAIIECSYSSGPKWELIILK